MKPDRNTEANFKKLFVVCFHFCCQHFNAETDGLYNFISTCVFIHSKIGNDKHAHGLQIVKRNK